LDVPTFTTNVKVGHPPAWDWTTDRKGGPPARPRLGGVGKIGATAPLVTGPRLSPDIIPPAKPLPMSSSFHTKVPVIETERLKMRGHRLADLNDCAAMWADPIVTRHIGGRPFSEEETWARFLRYAGHWSLMGFGYW